MTDRLLPIALPGLSVSSHDFVTAHILRWRGDAVLASAAFGVDVSIQPGHSRGNAVRIIWLAPSEVLVLRLPQACSVVAPGTCLVSEASDALMAYRVAGSRARDYLAKGCSLDLGGPMFGRDRSAQTRFAQIYIVLDEPADDVFDLYVERSYGAYFEKWLIDAAVEFQS